MLNARYPLGFFPTPLQHLERLSARYEGHELYIKRDDHTGLASGGNKTRKLEYLIQAALDEGCDSVITAGAQQSNHCRQTAAACAIAGLECHLTLGGDPPAVYNGNLLLSSILGAEITFTGENRKGEEMAAVKAALEARGKKPYLIPYGGSNGIGALGFVRAVQELKAQLMERELSVDYIFFASSSGGMQAGLTMGIELYQLETTLVPISIDKAETNGLPLQQVVFNLVSATAPGLGIRREFVPEDTVLDTRYDSAGYGVVTDGERRAMRELARSEGILLDPVYTGRAFHGMLDSLESGKLRPGSKLLFWHTGGLPAIFDYAARLGEDGPRPGSGG